MNENFSDNNQPMSPILDARQQQVLRALRRKETDKFPLGDWYLGALYALENKYNPDRIAQAAQSLRELLEKLPRVVRESDVPRPYNFKEMRKNINKRWIKDKKRYDGKWKGVTVNNHFHSECICCWFILPSRPWFLTFKAVQAISIKSSRDGIQ